MANNQVRKVNLPGANSRAAEFDRASVNMENRTAELSFSSETPVERFFGNEILDHNPSSVRLGRLNNGAPLLMDHNTADQIGVVENAKIGADKRGRAVVRFGAGQRASEIFKDVQDGIRKNVSVSYRIHKMQAEKGSKDADDYRAMDWEPTEISIVSVPADVTVGVGRSESTSIPDLILEIPMSEVTDNTAVEAARKATEAANAATLANVRIEASQNARKDELERIKQIRQIGERMQISELANTAINEGVPVDQFRAIALDVIEKKNAKPADQRAAEIGLTDKEVKSYSFMRAINAMANPADRAMQEAAAFEFDVSRAAAKVSSKSPKGLLVPFDVLRGTKDSQRALSVGTATAGGNTVATDLLAGNFIDLLRNQMVVASKATTLGGLVGNIAIPRQSGAATSYWVAEAAAPTASQQSVDQVLMSPKTVGAYTDFSRLLTLQSSIDIEGMVRRDLATILALAIDQACINGAGSGGVPLGILNTSGIGTAAAQTNGSAVSWADLVALETFVAQSNALVGNLAYVTNSKVRGALKTTQKATGYPVYLWDTNGGDTPVNGYGCYVTNQIPATDTEGTGTGLSALIFGNWADLLVGMWGGLDLLVDPYTNSASGSVRVRVLQDVDVAVRHPVSFAAKQDCIA